MIRLREVMLPPQHTAAQLRAEAARLLRLPEADLLAVRPVRRSVDARKKPVIRLVYTLDVQVRGDEDRILRRSRCKQASIAVVKAYTPPAGHGTSSRRPVIVGFGPAGIFAALVLAMAGLHPLVLERGEDARTRHRRVERFFATGELDPVSNVQFGEGGAGTFSDGKLNTGLNNPRIGWILEQFVAAGAQEDILYDAKPHVGTDVLLDVVCNLRKRIEELGGEVRFRSQVTGICRERGRLTGLKLADGSRISCDTAVFAIGHSARDTVSMLHLEGIPMEQKPFAMGVRIEHRQSMINFAQYGVDSPILPPADYKLVRHLDDGSVYTFCMCPGGYVVAAASELGGVVTNGMSYAARQGENANAALLVSIRPEDMPQKDPLSGMRWQRELEQRAFRIAQGTYRAPAQLVGDFLAGRPSTGPGSVQPTYRPGVFWCDLHELLPKRMCTLLEQALPQLEGSLKGFAQPDAVLTAPETRSSSPVRILRGANRQSALAGLYPCGEGAGYAGGIMSAAIDGIMAAEAIISAMEG